MYGPRKNKLIYWFFSFYIARSIKRDFYTFQFNAVETHPDQAILLLANHSSWWDGFLLFRLNQLLFKRKFHIMVSEENYRKVAFLKYLGAFSVKKGSKDMLETLDYAGELLKDKNNLVVIFPQGKLYSSHVTQVDFERGLLRLAQSAGKKFQYVLAALFTDYFEHRKPGITVYLHNWQAEEFTSLQLIKNAYNKHYERSRQQQCVKIV
ncbi:glycerol acyltransferase (plasmid) [Pedobacter sp. BS3]|uniref:lysophospholipid acyltransferase family protein n=1 Tax=Pedobacter sp. BS3 TaxID=2567937 RepID=UPI0011F07E94|nr:lysophospholipid acyltransferase family protein [Pedobacter sp. BS3]TZF86087.1 glycerol acyltransferase [Pedobacter sp. BS3]